MAFRDEFPPGGDIPYAPPAMPTRPPAPGLYGMQPQDPGVELLTQLLGQKMEVPEPQKVGTGRRILGALGDFLASYGSMRMGGPANTPFASGMERRRQEYEAKKAAAEKYNTDIDNQARMLIIGHKLRLAEKKAAREEKDSELTKTPVTLQDKDGNPVAALVFTDRLGNRVKTVVVGERGYAPWIYPGEAGVTGPARIPRTGEPGPISDLPTKRPPAGAAQAIAKGQAVEAGFERLKGDWKEIHEYVKENKIGEGAFGKLETIVKGEVGESKYGGAFEFSKKFNQYATQRKRSLNKYVKQQTGAQFSIKELDRYESMWPQAWDDENTANRKISDLIETAQDDMNALLSMYPAAAGKIPVDDVDRFEALGIQRTRVLGEDDEDLPPEIQRLRELE